MSVSENSAMQYLYYDKPYTMTEMKNKYTNITGKDILKISNEIFVESKAVVSIMTDKKYDKSCVKKCMKHISK